jgi:hypothetical protein
MARFGLKSFLYAPLNADKTYGDVTKLAGAIDYKETINTNSHKQYEDDELQWEDSGFKDGNLKLTVGDDDEAIFAKLLGRKTKTITVGGEEKTVYVGGSNDIAIPVGFGFVEMFRNKEGIKYGVKFYPSVTFKPYATEGKTAGENKEYSNQAVEGTIASVDGEFQYYNRYATREEAIAVLYGLFGKEVPTATTEPITPTTEETPAGE